MSATEDRAGAGRTAYSMATAARWSEGVLVGSGIVGAVLFGAPERHSLVLSHERFFLPANSRRAAPELAPVLDEVREALARRDERAAADVIAHRLQETGWDPDRLIWTDPLAPIAQLDWIVEGVRSAQYERRIALDGADVSVSWSTPQGGRAGITVTAQRGGNALVIEVLSEHDGVGRLLLGPVIETEPGVGAVDYSQFARTTATSGSREQVVAVATAGREPGTGREARARLTATSAQTPSSGGGWRVRLRGGVPQRFRVEVTTGGRHVDVDPGIEAAALSRSVLDLGSGAARAERSTEEIWAQARSGDGAAERGVVELAYSAGRRNIVCSTGALPPTLQGVWQGTWAPAWSADYTMNGNLQLGGLADVLWTGNPQLMTSLFRLVLPFADHYRSNARRIFGLPGMLLPARLSTHGHANHLLRGFPHVFWIGNGPWFLRLLADYIQVTGDRTVLDERMWELTLGVLEFSLAVLEAGGEHLNPSYSPENTPAGRENPLVTDATADIAAVRDGLAAGAWLAQIRGDRERGRTWQEARNALPGYRIAADGTLAEWGEGWQEHLEHRHASQLHGLWYEPDPPLTSGPLREAALATIRGKLAWRAGDPTAPPGRMEMAFGLTSLGLAAAHLGDAESAHRCALWLARDHFTPALTSTHDAGSVFNVDASGGLPALVAAMLFDSRRDRIGVLPAHPAAWRTGRITGLTGRGAVILDDLRWARGSVSAAITLRPDGAWMRPEEGMRIDLPWPAGLVDAVGVEQVDDRTLRVLPDAPRQVFFDVRR
ncbi:MAG: glycoside hydrolase N-terminal domain-containing protein [Actinobacteria bacterium]|nr:glycoside hydrolase N-terminal domain-containing protein [Actinomycetota bacterium]